MNNHSTKNKDISRFFYRQLTIFLSSSRIRMQTEVEKAGPGMAQSLSRSNRSKKTVWRRSYTMVNFLLSFSFSFYYLHNLIMSAKPMEAPYTETCFMYLVFWPRIFSSMCCLVICMFDLARLFARGNQRGIRSGGEEYFIGRCWRSTSRWKLWRSGWRWCWDYLHRTKSF